MIALLLTSSTVVHPQTRRPTKRGSQSTIKKNELRDFGNEVSFLCHVSQLEIGPDMPLSPVPEFFLILVRAETRKHGRNV